MRKTILILSCLCLGLLAVLGVKIWHRWQVEVLNIQPPKMQFRAARQTFQFSVIPGGLMDTQELADSMKQDPVVREHYKDVQLTGMYFMRLQKPMMAYVSWRKDKHVGWTSHPVMLPANELVLTDGKKMIRARCGNRIEIKKPEPLPTKVVPPEVPPPDVAIETSLPALAPPTFTAAPPPGTQIASLAKPTDRIATPPTTWCCSLVETPSNVPEPGSIVLVGAGLLGLLLLGRNRLF